MLFFVSWPYYPISWSITHRHIHTYTHAFAAKSTLTKESIHLQKQILCQRRDTISRNYSLLPTFFRVPSCCNRQCHCRQKLPNIQKERVVSGGSKSRRAEAQLMLVSPWRVNVKPVRVRLPSPKKWNSVVCKPCFPSRCCGPWWKEWPE